MGVPFGSDCESLPGSLPEMADSGATAECLMADDESVDAPQRVALPSITNPISVLERSLKDLEDQLAAARRLETTWCPHTAALRPRH